MNFTEDPQNEYYYYDGGEEYGDVYYDNEEYKETYNYEDASEGKKYFLFLSKRTQKKSVFIYVFSLWDHPYIMSAILHTHLEYDVRFFENPPTYFLRIIK